MQANFGDYTNDAYNLSRGINAQSNDYAAEDE